MKGTGRIISAQEALEKAQALCSNAERSSGEIRDKLSKWGISSQDTKAILASLIEDRYIDDRRFARAYVNDKVKFSHWGRRKIQQSLYQKHIESALTAEALADIDEEIYAQNLRNLIKAKIKASPALTESYEGRTKIFRHIISRGYESSLAATILKEELANLRNASTD